jgi:SAM-dependent methyltransferase
LSLERFFSTFQTAVESNHFIKCTLGRPGTAAAPDLKNIYLRPVEIKGSQQVAFNHRYTTRDEVKNYTPEAALAQLKTLLGTAFLNADLFTTEGDATLSFNKKGAAQVQWKPAAQSALPDTTHNRAKHRLLDPAAPWLHLLGITNAKGVVLAATQDKWKQINKFLEIIDSLVRAHPLPAQAHIADMGSGKGYLTFALYDFLTKKHGLQPNITGIELRQPLVDFCNKTAQQVGFKGLNFVAQDINDYNPPRLDILIALHACDTATDLALAKGVFAAAGIVVVAPCCHKQIRRDMATKNELAPVLQFGILEERQAEIVTDGIRALLMEANGYRTQVFEFISTEHTAKNVMITAVKEKKIKDNRLPIAQIEAIKTGFGVREHYLERLLQSGGNL